MNLSMQLAVVMAAACLCLSDAAPDTRVARKSQRPTRGFKNVEMMTARGFGKRDRPTRTEQSEGYATPIRRTFQPKCCHLLTAQRFGKRDSDDFSRETAPGPSFDPKSPAMFAGGFGKRDSDDASAGEVYGLDNFWEMLESAEKESQEGNEEKTLDSIPMDYFVNELLNNPDFARSVVRKFIDLNQDGMLSTEELLRNV